MEEILLDPNIRLWFLAAIPIVAFLVVNIVHDLLYLATPEPESTLEKVAISHALRRAKVLRRNGNYLCRSAFMKRKEAFNHKEHGFFRQKIDEASTCENIVANSEYLHKMAVDKLKNVLPKTLIGNIVSRIFRGVIITKLPFPITGNLRPLLQAGIQLQSLNPSWVSSLSWYYLSLQGLKDIFAMIGGENYGEHLPNSLPEPVPSNVNDRFKAEWESIELLDHHWILGDYDYQEPVDEKLCDPLNENYALARLFSLPKQTDLQHEDPLKEDYVLSRLFSYSVAKTAVQEDAFENGFRLHEFFVE